MARKATGDNRRDDPANIWNIIFFINFWIWAQSFIRDSFSQQSRVLWGST